MTPMLNNLEHTTVYLLHILYGAQTHIPSSSNATVYARVATLERPDDPGFRGQSLILVVCPSKIQENRLCP